MAIVQVERLGGLAGFGGMGSHIRSQGQLDVATLSDTDKQAIEALFQSRGDARGSLMRDGFRYKISRITSTGTQTIEAPESIVPAVLTQCVKDEFR